MYHESGSTFQTFVINTRLRCGDVPKSTKNQQLHILLSKFGYLRNGQFEKFLEIPMFHHRD